MARGPVALSARELPFWPSGYGSAHGRFRDCRPRARGGGGGGIIHDTTVWTVTLRVRITRDTTSDEVHDSLIDALHGMDADIITIEQEATPMKPGILEQLDKLIEEDKQTRSQIYFRGDKGSREYIRCEGRISGLQLARKAVADWIEENREEG
jgi:hypothetical protein